MEVTLTHYLVLAAVVFVTGLVGFIVRRNAIVMLMCVELMLNSVNLTLVAVSRQWGNLNGHIFVFMIMAVAAAEVAVGLAILIAHNRHSKTTNIDEMNLLKW